MNPINENAQLQINTGKDFSRVSPYTWFLNIRFKSSIAGALGLAVVFGGTSFAAQSALPGDVLYPIKIHINEKVESLLAFGPKNSAITEAKHAIERIKEEEKLSAQDKLTSEIKNKLEDDFSSEVENMSKDVKSLEDKGDTEAVLKINGNFNEKLSRHYGTIVNFKNKSTSSIQIIKNIKNKIDQDNRNYNGESHKPVGTPENSN